MASVFSGGGTVESVASTMGVTPIWGIEHAPEIAASLMRKFHVVADDCRNVDPDLLPPADILWLSPPCTERSNCSNHRAKDDSINEMMPISVERFARLARSVIAMECHPSAFVPGDAHFERTCAALRDAGWHFSTFVSDAADIGGASRRKRGFLVATRDGAHESIVADVLATPKATIGWDSVIDAEAILKHAPELEGKHGAAIRQWFDTHPEHDMVVYGYYSTPTKAAPGGAVHTITTVARHVVAHRDGRRGWLKADHAAILMGLDPSWFAGSERTRHKMIGNGVHSVHTRAIIGAIMSRI